MLKRRVLANIEHRHKDPWLFHPSSASCILSPDGFLFQNGSLHIIPRAVVSSLPQMCMRSYLLLCPRRRTGRSFTELIRIDIVQLVTSRRNSVCRRLSSIFAHGTNIEHSFPFYNRRIQDTPHRRLLHGACYRSSSSLICGCFQCPGFNRPQAYARPRK